jgi:nitrogen regulatory protein P-II 1
MKLITTIIRPEKLADVKAALFRAGVTGISVSTVQGHGGEGDGVAFVEKVRIDVAVSEPFVEPAIEAVITSARTGDVGDGKIFVQPLERVIRIRTGEQDVQALTRARG